MKIPIQEKIAELERRIVALEGQRATTVTTKTTSTTGARAPNLEPELTGLWKTFDALIAKAFSR